MSAPMSAAMMQAASVIPAAAPADNPELEELESIDEVPLPLEFELDEPPDVEFEFELVVYTLA